MVGGIAWIPCGFSSGGGGGQVATADDTRRKLELVREVAREVWG